MLLDILYDSLRRTNSKEEQSKIDGGKISECQKESPMKKILEEENIELNFKFHGTKEEDYKSLNKKR